MNRDPETSPLASPTATGRPRAGRRRGERGATLVEAAMAVAVAAISVGLAIPGFGSALERRHLEGVASQLETDLQYTRSLAVARDQTLRIGFDRDAQSSCYVVHTGGPGACHCSAAAEPVCTGAAVALRSVVYGPGMPVSLRSNVGSIAFEATKGTVTPTASIEVRAQGGGAIRQIVNVMGRVRSCSPAPALPGYKPC